MENDILPLRDKGGSHKFGKPRGEEGNQGSRNPDHPRRGGGDGRYIDGYGRFYGRCKTGKIIW
jgi:hypothetical protein